MSGWTEDCVEVLTKLWKQGLSATQIAARLDGNFSRNAVIGKVHRLGLAGRNPRQARRYPEKRKSPSLFRPTRLQLPVKKVSRPPLVPAKELRAMLFAADASLPDALRIGVLDLTDDMCRWPKGDPKEGSLHFCAKGRETGPYCGEHDYYAHQLTRRAR
jgi:GcrA cell cycle regulator